MQEIINKLIKETENKIIDILVRAYNSGRINEEGFNKYEMNEIKKLLFMRSELDDKLYDLLEGDLSKEATEIETDQEKIIPDIGHKYIKDIMDIEETPYGWCKFTGRDDEWTKQRYEYSFDERETWSLDSTFMYWLYERLMMFKEIGGVHIHLDFHKFNIDGIEMTQGECIDKMIENCKKFIENRSIDDELSYELKEETLKIWKECIHSMWW